MASLDRHLNPLYTIKECSSYGNLHTKDCGCSIGSLEDKILVPTLEEVFQDFQDTFESSDDDTNFVNENQEPFVVKQDPGVNSSQSPPHIDHCCYGCGDSLDDIFCQRCTCESCGKGAHYGYNCPPQVPIISKPEPCNNQTVNEFPQTLPSVHPTSCSGDENSFTYDSKPNFVDDSPNVFNPPPQPPMYSCEFCGNDARYGHYCTPQQMTTIRDLVGQFMQKKEEEKRITEDQAAKDRYWKISICYDDDEDYTIVITSVLPIKEPDNSLSMRDEYIDTVPATESDEVIKSSVEDLVQILSESEGIPNTMCDVPLSENTTPLNALNEHSEIVVDSNNDSTSSGDDSPYDEDIDYVDASPP
ncbi:hypothetical protein Tco_0829459, partial [Tanacetum coccineum]